MKIRNKKTGEVKEINPNQAAQYGIQSPASASTSIPQVNWNNQQPQQGGIGQTIGKVATGAYNAVAPVVGDVANSLLAMPRDVGGAIAPNLIKQQTPEQKASAERGTMTGMALAIPGTTGPTPELGPIVNRYAPNLTSKLGSFMKFGKGAEETAGTMKKPGLLEEIFGQRKIGQKIENVVNKGGTIRANEIENMFGKLEETGEGANKIVKLILPEDSTLANVGAAKDKQKVVKLLTEEMQALQKEGPLTYERIHQLETQAASLGKWEKGTAPTIEQSFYRKLSQQYSNILKNNLPELKDLFEAYGKSKDISKVTGVVKNRLPYVATAALGYYLLYKLLNGAGKITQNLTGE